MIFSPIIPQDLRTTASPTFANITDSGLTAGRVTYAGTAGLLQDSANLAFDGDDLTCAGDIFAANLFPSAWNSKADYAFGANSFTGSGDFSGGEILGTSVEAEDTFLAGEDKISFFGAASSSKTTITDLSAMGNADSEIGGLTISASYDQTEVQALRDKCEELADDVRAIYTKLTDLINALQGYGLI
jgi:hypothetical protein